MKGIKPVDQKEHCHGELEFVEFEELPRTPVQPYRPSFREYLRLARRRFIPRLRLDQPRETI